MKGSIIITITMLTLASSMGFAVLSSPPPVLAATRPSPLWDPGLQHQVLSHLWSSSLWPPRPLSIPSGGFKRGMWIVVWDKLVLVMDVSVMAEFGYKQQKIQIKVAQSIRTCIVSLPASTELGDPEPVSRSVERLPDASRGLASILLSSHPVHVVPVSLLVTKWLPEPQATSSQTASTPNRKRQTGTRPSPLAPFTRGRNHSQTHLEGQPTLLSRTLGAPRGRP